MLTSAARTNSKAIMVGQAVRDYIKSSKLNDKSVDKYYKSVKNFLFTAIKYLLKIFPYRTHCSTKPVWQTWLRETVPGSASWNTSSSGFLCCCQLTAS
ncbi:hypothetical protein RRG08_066793 [Elysia crispata]|uniref:Uncharacterized protein n=1 Tax=Elysia crispata TaxID=231223 RepID=A0AAE1CJQ2_9GAST|nr:hypothetical protein RRG08_066793 [Elysia crispata]